MSGLTKLPVEDATTSQRSSDRLVVGGFGTDEKISVSMVTGSDWEQWFADVKRSLHGGQVPDSWLHRLTKDDAKDVARFKEGKTSFQPDVHRLVFGSQEAPLARLFSDRKPGQEAIVGLKSGNDPTQFVKVYYSPAPRLSGLGSGIYGVPESFSYPLRHFWYIPLAIGCALYLILPWPASGKSVCAYKRWQVVLADFAGCLLYGTFMALPLLIVGGAVQAMTEWAVFTAFFWGLSALGLCCLWWSYFYAVYRIHILDGQLVLASPLAVKAVPYADMTSIEAVRVVPPRWLIILSFLSAFGARGQSGRALLLANSSAEGICIGTSGGDAVYVWTTNSMGQESLTNLDLLLSKLRAAPTTDLPDLREMEAIFPPVIEAVSRRKTSRLIKLDPRIPECEQFVEIGTIHCSFSQSFPFRGISSVGQLNLLPFGIV